MAVTPPETALRDRLIVVLEAEFEEEGFKFFPDKMSAARGQDGAIGAVYPGPTEVPLNNELVIEPTAYVQLFLKWTGEVNPKQRVDPGPIEEAASRIRRACQADEAPGGGGDSHLWFYSVRRIDYPPDPTGNISRLLATVVGKAQNDALTPTTG